jgi:hypothetical protein
MRTAMKWLYGAVLGGLVVIGVVYVWMHLSSWHGFA